MIYTVKLRYTTFNVTTGDSWGGDIGSCSANLFFHAILPTQAVSTITSALHDKQINRLYIIAVEGDEPSDGIAPYGVWVLYPEKHEGNLCFRRRTNGTQ